MKREQYLKLRNEKLTKAQELLDAGKFEELKAIKVEIEKFDNDFENIAKEQANLAALEGKVANIDISNQSVDVPSAKVVSEIKKQENISYETVFAKAALLQPLNNEEIAIYNKYNPENVYVHNTTNTEIMIPKTVMAGIENTMKELHPILNDVQPTHIKGIVKYVKHTKVKDGDADYYTEDTEVKDEENEFAELTLGAKELAKSVTVTWKLQAMAVDEFIPYIQRELGERMGNAKARAFVNGAGDAKYPQGVVTAIKAESGTPQKVEFASATGLTYKDITNAMSKVKSAYKSGAKIYANNTTVWNVLANIMDKMERPLFIPDVTAGGVGRILGVPVFEEDAMKDNEILIGNMASGYKENVQEGMKLVTDQHAKARTTDFVGYESHDGGVYDTKAFAYIVKGV